MTAFNPDRRTFLKASGATALFTLAAGCLGSDDDEPDAPTNGDDDGDDGGDDAGDDYDFGDWFDNTDSYDGVEDHTGEDEVLVLNGTGAQGVMYDPPAIVVDPGTTVVWEWTGDGGSHDVVAEEGEFESELTGDEGFTFEHTFDDEGEFRYKCTAHDAMGQRGVVIVE